jgi:hypothetical protein
MPRGVPVASAMTAAQRVLGRSLLARTVALPHDRRLSIPVLRRKGSIMGYVFPESSEEIYPPGNGPRILDGRMLSRRIRAGIKAQVGPRPQFSSHLSLSSPPWALVPCSRSPFPSVPFFRPR